MAKILTAQCFLLAIMLVIDRVKTQGDEYNSTTPLYPEGPCSGGTGLLRRPEGQLSMRTTYISVDMTCQWKIEVDKDKRVSLHFSSIDIIKCKQCSCGKINIYDGSDSSAVMIKSICGNYSHDNITSSGNTVLVYYAAVSGNTLGFMITYSSTQGKLFT
ncbi:hypothetical protein NP493_60g05065 [Ridgeia piscesae]|uniref:CUB domain-containing protein n=1 Tax=Ridgeia piscesae TaxID=27915 RepID=A0AAD9PA73_RIDPI|nr:hypothetical protein NP493_60g05065 [Ridgeia piscesae]